MNCEQSEKIAVLLSTYNGELYLREQIDSIISQTNANQIVLFIRDDGSNDSTPNIIREYTAIYENIHFLNPNDRVNKGVRDSFFELLRYAFDDEEKFKFFAFSDQDDVWKENKLSEAYKALSTVPDNDRGKLYFSNKTFVNEELDVIQEETIRFYDDFMDIFWQNLASGCTMVIDRKLTSIAIQHSPQCTCIHDGWIYRLSRMINATIIFDRTSYILYRQHNSNTVGMKSCKPYHLGSLLDKKKRSTTNRYEIIQEINSLYRTMIPKEKSRVINDYLNSKASIQAKWRLIHNREMKKRDVRTRIAWATRILLNRL